MKAWFINSYGGPEILECGDIPEPVLGPRDVLVNVRAASLNPIDIRVRKGELKRLVPYTLSWTLAIAIPLLTSCGDLCGNQESQRTDSPSNNWTAVAFTRDCGATTGFSSQISLIAKGSALPNESGNVLVLEASVPLHLTWSPSGDLVVHGSGSVKRFKEEGVVSGVKIQYL